MVGTLAAPARAAPSVPATGQDVSVLECIVNVSEGRSTEIVTRLAEVCGDDLLDLHIDPHHNRSVFTLVGEAAPRRLAEETWRLVDLSSHDGVHPRIGAVDVVPFVALGNTPSRDAVRARDDFVEWAATEHGIPCFLYGAERTLPAVRSGAFTDLVPDAGPTTPDPRVGAVCVGARDPLVAWNMWLDGTDVEQARRIAAAVRGPHLRTLGLDVGGRTQLSCNLVDPGVVGPADAHRLVSEHAEVTGAELVGLLEARVLAGVPAESWEMLDLAPSRTVEVRLARRALIMAARAANVGISR